MIQRIQSIFLSLVIAASITIFFYPIARFYSGNIYCQFDILKISSISVNKINFPSTLPFILMVIAIGLLSIITLFLYKNRPIQIKLCKINILINILLIIMVFFYADNISKIIKVEADYKIGAYLPLVSLVFLILSNWAIRKDEKLVKSQDRLR